MKKITAAIVLIGIVVPMVTACRTTTTYTLAVRGVPNVRELYIRNAGSASWGANLAGSINDIDISRFPRNVDIRVVDANGIVHSRYNIPFASAFVETDSDSQMNLAGSLLGAVALLGLIIVMIANMDMGYGGEW